jgi:opacity protein-like surface antigen
MADGLKPYKMTEPHDNRMSPSHKNIMTLRSNDIDNVRCRKYSWGSCMSMSRVHLGILSILLGGLAGPALADGVSGLYIGASGGLAKIGYDNSAYQTQIQDAVTGFGTLDFTSASLHDRKTAWWANAGYMAWPFVGIDASYLHLGELYNQVNGSFTANDGTVNSVGAATRMSSEGPALGLLFRLPLTENFDIHLRVADYYAHTTLTNILNAASYSTTIQTSNESSLLAALGVSYAIAGHWSARLDYLRIERAGDSATTGKYNAAILAAGASYTF